MSKVKVLLLVESPSGGDDFEWPFADVYLPAVPHVGDELVYPNIDGDYVMRVAEVSRYLVHAGEGPAREGGADVWVRATITWGWERFINAYAGNG